MYKGVQINIGGCELKVDILALELHDFDVILGMDCFIKIVTLQGPDGQKIVFEEERNVISNCIISVMAARKMIKKRCEAYLAYVLETKKEDIQVSNVPIVREFPDVFPDELPGVPLEREVEVTINILPCTSPIA
jgi:hypothetical protein